jgi:hypothetical protein
VRFHKGIVSIKQSRPQENSFGRAPDVFSKFRTIDGDRRCGSAICVHSSALFEGAEEKFCELTLSIASRTQPDLKLPAHPKYSMRYLGFAIREASLSFIETWDALLGFKYADNTPAAPWQSV